MVAYWRNIHLSAGDRPDLRGGYLVPLRQRLASVNDCLAMRRAELDVLAGGLPRSAYEHAAFWSGARGAW